MNTYKTHGVCSREIRFEIEDNKIRAVQFVGGCAGNTQGVARLIEGMDYDADAGKTTQQIHKCGGVLTEYGLIEGMDIGEAIRRIDGIDCAGRGTSCPDQLAKALKEYQKTH